jgi:uncharacterized protein (DUF362 family)
MEDDVRLYIDRIGDQYRTRISEGLNHIDVRSRLKAGGRVFIKPNLTYPRFKPGVVTTPECVEALVLALKDYTSHIIIGESDGGGYNPFAAEEAFESLGLNAIAQRYGAEIVNLSQVPSKNIQVESGRHHVAVPLPAILLDDIDLFITVPVPKMHSSTTASISVKNQWGCIPEPSIRLTLHPYFNQIIWEINRRLSPVTVVDGTFGLNRTGPLHGDPVPLDWVVISNDIVAADLACFKIMGVDPFAVRPYPFLKSIGEWPDLAKVAYNRDFQEFAGQQFFLKRELMDFPGAFAFRWRWLAHLAYHSSLAALLHKVMYLFRNELFEYKYYLSRRRSRRKG